ncbi:dTMP kinase [Candidatus Acidulodesulfobacterium sp. H_13]|uniref:dTMP kinase n=1 Tax=Candidatus Acidulodesulfobacterium sp. H_13 TaxID=3395470 RepID=UPI003AF8963F
MGIFITLEGIDGSGKTTASKLLCGDLAKDGYRVLPVKEPTETLLGNFINDAVLGTGGDASFMKSIDIKTSALAALFLFSADRTVHVDEIIAKLSSFDIIICDRFIDSTYAYQTADMNDAEGICDLREFILTINEFILNRKNFNIARTYLLDLEPKVALNRLSGRVHGFDGFDGRSPDFFSAVREGYRYLSTRYRDRIKIIDASCPPENIAIEILKDLRGLVDEKITSTNE